METNTLPETAQAPATETEEIISATPEPAEKPKSVVILPVHASTNAWRENLVLSSPEGKTFIQNKVEVFTRFAKDDPNYGQVRDMTLQGKLIDAIFATPVVPDSPKTLQEFINDPRVGEERFAIGINIGANAQLLNTQLRDAGATAARRSQAVRQAMRDALISTATEKAQKGKRFESTVISQGKTYNLPDLIGMAVQRRYSSKPELGEAIRKEILDLFTCVVRNVGRKLPATSKAKFASNEVRDRALLALMTSFLPQERSEDIVHILNEELIPAIEAQKPKEDLLVSVAKIEAIASSFNKGPILGKDTDIIKKDYGITSMEALGIPDNKEGIAYAAALVLIKIADQTLAGADKSPLTTARNKNAHRLITAHFIDSVVEASERIACVETIKGLDPETYQAAETIASTKEKALESQGFKVNHIGMLMKELAELRGIELRGESQDIITLMKGYGRPAAAQVASR